MTGLINLDFADVKSVMQNAGTALMAVGEGRGDGRAVMAARAAISSPLLDVSIEGARGVLLNVSGGPDLTLAEITEAAETIQAAVDPDANIFFGAVIHPRAQDDVRVTVIATGLHEISRSVTPAPRQRTAASEPAPPPPSPPRESDPRPRYPEPSPPPASRPAATEWERSRTRPPSPQPAPPPSSSQPAAPPPATGEDDWDVPTFLRRPRR
jgi:cell division protein FtsZ